MAVLVATLIDQGKLLSDKRSDASIDDATGWLAWINWEVESLWRFITAMDPNLYFASTDFTLSGGFGSGSTFDLTTIVSSGVPQFRAMHGLDYFPDTTNRRTIPRRNFRERNVGPIGPWIPSALSIDRAYDLRGRTLTITPYEVAAGPYRVYYRRKPYAFTGTADATPLDSEIDQYSELIAVGAAIRAMVQEESDASQLVARREELKQQIADEHTRDDGAPTVIADIEGDQSGRWW